MKAEFPVRPSERSMKRSIFLKSWNEKTADGDLGMSVDTSLLAGYPVIVESPVAWGDMDSYEHVNNVVYFRYFENARLEYFRRLGWFEFEEQTGIGPILAYTQARFRRALTYPDTISIGARVISLADDRFTLEHEIVSHDQAAVATEG